jgi:hypothetical protein
VDEKNFGYLKLDEGALNEALWAACNTRFEEPAPSMEDVSRAAENAVRAYLESLFWEAA